MDTFLDESQTFMRAITDSFHLVNTSRAGLELLSGQVSRVVTAGADDRVIEALFPMPDGTTGQNLRAHTLRDQAAKDRDLAEMWLFVAFARYETWAESLEVEYGIAGASRASQFAYAHQGAPGYGDVFPTMSIDRTMDAIYSQAVSADNLYLSSTPIVEAALQLFRFYKEVRNSFVHSNARANVRLATASVNAQAALVTLQGATTLRTGAVPILTVGDPVSVSLALVRDVIALLRRLVFTIDAHLLLSPIGVAEFERRWIQKYGSNPVNVSLSKLKRPAWFNAHVSHALAMPSPPLSGRTDGAVWPPASREAFVDFATPRWMIRRT
ncbi:hypothetical protein [Microbacterium sp. cx-59]|uniref:hypothetical protein n=1 Tax=Microbacterium sp. cx-59 TaxID=2891207 RepID=UPI001E5FD5B3|nr:hypothetical protein [Microbacterium sp. cx-59]MCC4907753.1 hypothetical protein [Microbacterium sp. cx-59]